jgi:hypothetical protein
LDFRFWIVKALPVGIFTNSNVASLNPIGITSQDNFNGSVEGVEPGFSEEKDRLI